jgi:sucrose-6-phosphate hydrolase SacC (GH32 family)
VSTLTSVFPLPGWTGSTVAIPPPDNRPGAWSGAPSVVRAGDEIFLAYRLRRPVGEGRGFANVIASSTDGVRFTTVAEVHKERFGGESLERPALVQTPEGRWRLYVSVATPGTKHWRVDLLEADTPAGLATAPARTVLPGDDGTAVKDPVLIHYADSWHMWASVHPLDSAEHTDRMSTWYATSPDGVAWTWHGVALAGRPERWDARGVRVTSVVAVNGTAAASYDGRASAAENWEERTGLAYGTVTDGRFGALVADEAPPTSSPYAPHGLRYLSLVMMPDGRRRIYYEATRADGAHELRTELVP